MSDDGEGDWPVGTKRKRVTQQNDHASSDERVRST